MFTRDRFFPARPLGCLVPLVACLCLSTFTGPADAAPPTVEDARVTKIVSALLERRHVSRRPLDDDLSRRALELYVESLDRSKLFFLQSDIDEFNQYATKLDDLSKKGDLSPAFAIFDRFLQRLDQRVKVAQQLLSGSFDFTVNEKAVVDADQATFATSQREARDRWRREIKLQLLVLKAKDEREREAAIQSGADPSRTAKVDDPHERLMRRYRRLQTRTKQLSSDKILERYLTALTSAYDPHSTYMSSRTMDEFMIMMRLNLQGIGAELREEDDYTVISKLIDGGAAAKSETLAVGDKLLAVAQGNDEDWVSVVGVSVSDIASIVRGKSGTTVRLKLKSVAGDVKEATLKRTRVDLADRGATGRVVPFMTDQSESLKVGYIFLPSFYRDADAQRRGDPNYRSSTRDVKKLIEGFSQQQVDAVVLDLRSNGGGFLDEAINVTGLFIDQGPVVQVKDFRGQVAVYRDEDAGIAWSGPLALLTSKFSASASEIVAGAIKEYRRGLIVGDSTTHGKGTVQTPLDVAAEIMGDVQNRPSYGALKVTIQKYYLPDGDSTQLSGVTSDVVLPSITAMIATDESELKHALPNDSISAVNHKVYAGVAVDLVNQLRRSSIQRVDGSDDFAKLLRQRDAFQARKEQSHLSIEQTTFAKERAKLIDSDAEANEPLEPGQTFPADHYDREVMEIVQDYVDALATRSAKNTG